MASPYRLVQLINPQGATVVTGLVPRGAYNNGTTYNLGDSVSYLGSSYVAITSTVGNLPTDTTKWQVIASKGADGTGTFGRIFAFMGS